MYRVENQLIYERTMVYLPITLLVIILSFLLMVEGGIVFLFKEPFDADLLVKGLLFSYIMSISATNTFKIYREK